jgi:hypothetical protein
MFVLAANTVTVGSQTEKRNTNVTFIQEMSIDLHNKNYAPFTTYDIVHTI